MNNRILIKTISEFLSLTNFKPKSDGAGSISLNCENKRIGIGYTKGVVGLRLPPQIAGYVSFAEVENILEPYYKKYNIGYQPYTIYKFSRRFEHLSSIDLNTPDDIQKVGTELKTMVYEDILPFFEKYKDISSVVNHMESLDKENISRFICHLPVPRIMTLKKLNNSNDWREFCEWAVGTYESMASQPNGSQYESQKKLICELNEKLIIL